MVSYKRVTLKDVAHAAGCSVSAASKILNHAKGGAGVGPELAERISQTAAELGYVTNVAARLLKQGRSSCIGFLHDSNNDGLFWSQLLDGIHESARDENQQVMFFSNIEELVKSYIKMKIDAAVILRASCSSENLEMLKEIKFPFVTVDIQARNNHSADLIPNFKSATRTAIHKLIKHNKSNMLWVYPTLDKQRMDSDRWPYVEADCQEFGVHCTGLAINYEKYHWDWGDALHTHDTLNQHLNERQYDSIMVFNDQMLPGVVSAVQERQLHIPHDIAIISFDNMLAGKLYPKISSIDLGMREMGRNALKLALARIGNADYQAPKAIEASFISRSSTLL